MYRVPTSKIIVHPHPSYVTHSARTISPEAARNVLELPENHRVYLALGNIDHYKGLLWFWQSALESEIKDFTFVVAGRVENLELGKKLTTIAANDKRLVTFFGEIQSHLLQIYFQASDVAVLPYHNITTSGAVHLAMSFAKPTIVTDLCCLGEMSDELGSWKVKAMDTKNLVQTILIAHSTPSADLVQMGEHNYNKMLGLTWDNLAKRVARRYRQSNIPERASPIDYSVATEN